MIYLVTFVLSIFLLYIGLTIKEKHSICSKTLILLALLLPCLLASYRSLLVGTDTDGYPLSLYNLSLNSISFKDYLYKSPLLYNIDDFGFLLITYLSAKVFHSFKFLLFIVELFIIVPIYKSISLNNNEKYNIIFGMIIFYFYIYNVTFNMMRQSIALSFYILGLSYLIKDKKYISFLFLLISISFHSTAVIGLFIYITYFVYHRFKNEKSKKMLFIALIFVTVLLLINYKNIIFFLYNTGIYKHGLLYLQKFSKLDFSFMDTFTYLFLFTFYLLNNKLIKADYKFYKFLFIESIITLQFGMFVQYLERISLYFLYPVLIIIFPSINSNRGLSKINRNSLILFLFLLAYWIIIFVILRLHNTIPYEFS